MDTRGTLQICQTRNGAASARIFRAHRTRTSQTSRPKDHPRRRFLRAKERLSLAVVAEGFSTLEDRLRLVQEMAHRWDMEAPERRGARTLARTARQGSQAQCSDSGLPVGQATGVGGKE